MSDGLGSEAAAPLGELTALPGISAATHVANLDVLGLPFLPMRIRNYLDHHYGHAARRDCA